MTGSRRYKLLCPIARALDRIGDRWTLLILRDLHAGPARFSELLYGLRGIASNLLTDRLQQLSDDGLVTRREAEHGVALYELTELGRRTRDTLFELAMFGGRFPPDEELRRPGNLRTVAVTLEAAAQRVVSPDMAFRAEIRVDGEPFTLAVGEGVVTVRAGTADAPDVALTTSYEPMVAAAEGEMAMETFMADHASVETFTSGRDAEMMRLLAAAMALLQDES